MEGEVRAGMSHSPGLRAKQNGDKDSKEKVILNSKFSTEKQDASIKRRMKVNLKANFKEMAKSMMLLPYFDTTDRIQLVYILGSV